MAERERALECQLTALQAENETWKELVIEKAEMIVSQREENERLKERLREQTQQTQETAVQIRDAVLAAIERHGGLPDGCGVGHPIEQIVGTLLATKEAKIERLRLERDMLVLNVLPKESSVYVVWDGENVAAVAWPESVASSDKPVVFPKWYRPTEVSDE